MKKLKNGAIPAIKKNLEAFISEEEGAISKKDALYLGLSIVMLGSALADTAAAQATHSSGFTNTADRGVHNSHSVHSNGHGSHSSCHSDNCFS